MTKRQREKLLPGVIGILRAVAWRYHEKTGVPFDELLSDAYLGFMQACDKWRPEFKVKFSTWCQTKATTCILTNLNKRFKDRLVLVEEIKDEMLPIPPAAFRHSILDQVRDLSPAAQKMVNLLINHPLPDGESKPKDIFKAACHELSFDGYDDKFLDIASHEIKCALDQ